MRAGKLRHKITIQSATEAKDSWGEVEQTPVTFAGRWASVEPLSGRELFTAQQVNPDVSTKVTLRYLAGVTSKMQVIHKGRTLNIASVINVEERNIELVLYCVEPK